MSKPIAVNQSDKINIVKVTQQKELKLVSQTVLAPIVFSFACWVIEQAQQQGFKRLYFLARDGYIIYRVAQMICKESNIGLECRYLIGSRTAWRFAGCDASDKELYEQLFAGAGNMTLHTLLARVRASKELRLKIYNEIGFLNIDCEDHALSKNQVQHICRQLRNSENYCAQVKHLCSDARQSVAGYLRQEGLFDLPYVALVDTGWSGSIQKTLANIIHQQSETPVLIGFYMGLFSHPSEPENGSYKTWLFGPDAPTSWLAGFNNNVLECICMSPFPMAVGYQRDSNGVYCPVYDNAEGESNNFQLAAMQIDTILETIIEWYKNGTAKQSYLTVRQAQHLIFRFTRHPKPYEARAMGRFSFCDDMSNNYFFPLACPLSAEEWKRYRLLQRLWHKFICSQDKQQRELFWSFGSIAISRFKSSWIARSYAVQIYLWEYIRQGIKKMKQWL